MRKLVTIMLIASGLCNWAISQSKIIFSRSPGKLNSGGTIDLMIYDPVKKTTSLLIKGTVRGRGEYNVTTSPDNSRIIFGTYRYRGWKLAIADFKGGKVQNVRRLTDRSNYEYNAMFSPDGKHIAYQEFNWGTNDIDIFIADSQGRNAKQVIKSPGGDRTPVWTRDGKHIIFTSGRSGNYDLYKSTTEGADLKRLTTSKGQDFAPSTSMTEDKIAFLSARTGKINLYVMDYGGSGLINLTPTLKTDPYKPKGFEGDGGWAFKTSWSPDGKQIVFNALVNGNLELFTVNSDGSGLTQITKNGDSDIGPYWMN